MGGGEADKAKMVQAARASEAERKNSHGSPRGTMEQPIGGPPGGGMGCSRCHPGRPTTTHALPATSASNIRTSVPSGDDAGALPRPGAEKRQRQLLPPGEGRQDQDTHMRRRKPPRRDGGRVARHDPAPLSDRAGRRWSCRAVPHPRRLSAAICRSSPSALRRRVARTRCRAYCADAANHSEILKTEGTLPQGWSPRE